VERSSSRAGVPPAEVQRPFGANYHTNYGTVEALFAVAMRLALLTVFPGIIDVDVILNCTFPVLREIDFQMRPIAPLITLKHSETNQIVGTFGVELGEVPAFRQWLYQKVAVLVSSRTLEKYRWLLSKWNATKKRYSAYGPMMALGNFAHGIHLSHGRYHVTRMGIAGMAGAKISQSIVDMHKEHNA